MHRAILLIICCYVLSATKLMAMVPIDLSNYQPGSGVKVEVRDTAAVITWPMSPMETGRLMLDLGDGRPLIRELAVSKSAGSFVPLLEQVDPVYFLTVGSRDLTAQGWSVFFDNPPRRPHETFEAVLDRKSARVESHGKKTTVILDSLTAGTFRGDLRFTVYPGCQLVHIEAVLSTTEDARAILYDAGLVSPTPQWKTVSWIDNHDRPQQVAAQSATEAKTVAVRQRTIVAGNDSGSVAMFPPPHQFLYPLDFADNFQLTWHGRGYRTLGDRYGFGVRQPPEGDGRFVPWINAPPNTQQHLSVFLLPHAGSAAQAIDEVRRFTHGDRFVKLDGYRTFTSHFHIEHTLNFLKAQREQQTDGIPNGMEQPPFVKAFKDHGVEIAHLAEFHVSHTPEFILQRLPQLQRLHAECRRLSDEGFLLLPGEEPNVHLGGHWISLFPRPVYWLLHPSPETPFEQQVDGIGTVYAVHSAAEVLRLMEKEQGLMWTAHARTKSSFGFPDKYRDTDFYRSDRFLGAAWKAMPADLSQPRLGRRVLDLMDDMENWGPRKQVIGEVDVFKVFPEQELYGHMNINYLKMDKLPRFDDGWQPVLDALRNGKFFVTTGEMLITGFRVGGKESGETLTLSRSGDTDVTAHLDWTFPPSFAEIITGDGTRVQRTRIDLSEQPAFGSHTLRWPVDLAGQKWLRLEVWDIAANGAFTQPVWLE